MSQYNCAATRELLKVGYAPDFTEEQGTKQNGNNIIYPRKKSKKRNNARWRKAREDQQNDNI